MDYSTQLQANALLQRLIAEGTTFSATDAKELRRLLDPQTVHPMDFMLMSSSSRTSMEGVTSSGAQASLSYDEERVHVDTQQKGNWVGRFSLLREDKGDSSSVIIRHRFYDSKEDGATYTIKYRGGEPTVMKRMAPGLFKIGPIGVGFAWNRKWKVPL